MSTPGTERKWNKRPPEEMLGTKAHTGKVVWNVEHLSLAAGSVNLYSHYCNQCESSSGSWE